ncbi:MAG: monomethylamine:corrinoid methyltransferase, partial [Methanomassiliicoccaceae archaeon]|nr:monomethylamine:corrinoid methyltransferase [Methanomassiliicoccaceae archaeon]
AGMKVSDLNEVIGKVLSKYEKGFVSPPLGKTFRECYDVRTVKPTAEYLDVYAGAVKTLRECGLDIKH